MNLDLTAEERAAYDAAYDAYTGYVREARLRESHGPHWWDEFTRRSAAAGDIDCLADVNPSGSVACRRVRAGCRLRLDAGPSRRDRHAERVHPARPGPVLVHGAALLADLPLAAIMFKGTIEQRIRTELDRLLAT